MRIATLGPAGTFSELAACEYGRQQTDYTLQFFPALGRVLKAIPNEADVAVVPIENIVEGMVSPVIDTFVKRPLEIVAELSIPVRFSLVANSPKPEKIYAQFVAQGQCSDCLGRYDVPIMNTASNSEALQLLLQSREPAAAVVPEHCLAQHHFDHVEHDITDYAHNETRFVAVREPQQQPPERDPAVAYKTSLLIVDDTDHPGLLVEHLQVFAGYRVNLTSLVSRPTGQKFGHYHFYLECEGHQDDSAIRAALTLIALRNRVVVLGSYPSSAGAT
ncbi:ACT domain-containing protein [Pseudidiomarina sediminum]|uniref:prephenate dehydratase n=1 Tax=Pseudidiomarina sediminum TaxID=431675 RepID=A0A432ZAE1_9GAMM|nr:prephenate dehydratase domain-containing protein [Pseudidiomarina sediminum]MBY6064087.1 ACT domain-containing protein [Pseudidiomarina sediminum]RUO74879.1 ACT domain-containing protein [Pseudidiomarina sediminum]